MNLRDFQVNWFDLLFVVVVAVGLIRGRKRGMSEELLDVFQWLLIIVLGGLFYEPVGDIIARTTRMGTLIGHIMGYCSFVVLLVLIFGFIKRLVGEKLVHSDAFGPLEYYLGMIAGAVRFFCVMLFGLSILHAFYISPAEREQQVKIHSDSFGNIKPPSIASLQHDVFITSTAGSWIERTFGEQLITPISSSGQVMRENIGRQRQRSIDEITQ